MVEYGSKAFELILSEYTHIERVGCRVRGGSSLQAYFLDEKICVFFVPKKCKCFMAKANTKPDFLYYSSVSYFKVKKTLRTSAASLY